MTPVVLASFRLHKVLKKSSSTSRHSQGTACDRWLASSFHSKQREATTANFELSVSCVHHAKLRRAEPQQLANREGMEVWRRSLLRYCQSRRWATTDIRNTTGKFTGASSWKRRALKPLSGIGMIHRPPRRRPSNAMDAPSAHKCARARKRFSSCGIARTPPWTETMMVSRAKASGATESLWNAVNTIYLNPCWHCCEKVDSRLTGKRASALLERVTQRLGLGG